MLRWTEQHDIQDEVEKRRKLERPSIEDLLAATPKASLDLIASVLFTVIEELRRRAVIAAERIGAESFIVAGGVASNTGLRERGMRESGLPIYFPSLSLATDNAAMIAGAAFPKFERQEFAGLDLRATAGLVLA